MAAEIRTFGLRDLRHHTRKVVNHALAEGKVRITDHGTVILELVAPPSGGAAAVTARRRLLDRAAALSGDPQMGAETLDDFIAAKGQERELAEAEARRKSSLSWG